MPFLFADRFSGAVVHLTTGALSAITSIHIYKTRKQKMPAAVELTQALLAWAD
jgi:hypothetical protein